MKNKLQKAMKMVLALCMAAVLICSVPSNAQAAGYVKSFTKTVTLKSSGQCCIYMARKKSSGEKKSPAIRVTVSTTSKSKNLDIQATIPTSYSEDYATLTGKKKKDSFKVSVETKTPVLYVTNYGRDTVKVKIKVSAQKKMLKFKKKIVTTGDVG